MHNIGQFNKQDQSQVVGKKTIKLHASTASLKGKAGLDLFSLKNGKDLVRENLDGSIELFHGTNSDTDGVYMKFTLGEEVAGPEVDGTYRQKYNAQRENSERDIAIVEIVNDEGKSKYYKAVSGIDIHKARKDVDDHVHISNNSAEIKSIKADQGKALLMSQLKEVLVLYYSGDSPKELGRGLRGDSWFSWRTLLGLNHLKDAPVKTNESLLLPGQEVEANPTGWELFKVFVYQILAPISGYFPEIISQGVDPITKQPVLDKFENPVEVILSKPRSKIAVVIYGIIAAVGLTFMILSLTVFGFPFASPIPILFLLMAASPLTLGIIKTLYKNGVVLSILAAGMTGLFEICLTRYGQAKNAPARSYGTVLRYFFFSVVFGFLAAVACMPIAILNKETPLDNMKLPPNVRVGGFMIAFKYFGKNIGRVAIVILAIGVIGLAGSGSSLAFLVALVDLSWMITIPAITVQWILWPLGLVLQFGLSTSLSAVIVTAMATSATATLAAIQLSAIIAAIWVLYPSARELFKIIGNILIAYTPLKKRFPNLTEYSTPPLHDTVKHKSPGEELSFLESVVAIFKNSLGGAKTGYVFEQMIDLIAARLFLVPLKDIAKSTKMNSLYTQKGELIKDENGKPAKNERGEWIVDGSGNKINFTPEGELIKNIDLANRLAWQHIQKLHEELTRQSANAPGNQDLKKYLNIVNYYYYKAENEWADAEAALSEWRIDYNNLNTQFLNYLKNCDPKLDRATLYSTDQGFIDSVEKAEILAYASAEQRVFDELKETVLAAGNLEDQKNALKAILKKQIEKGGYAQHVDAIERGVDIDALVDTTMALLWHGRSGILWQEGFPKTAAPEREADELEEANNLSLAPDDLMLRALTNFKTMCSVGAQNNPARSDNQGRFPFRVLTDFIKEETCELLKGGKPTDETKLIDSAVKSIYGKYKNIKDLKTHINIKIREFLADKDIDESKIHELMNDPNDGILKQLFLEGDAAEFDEDARKAFYERLKAPMYHRLHGDGELKECINYLKKEIDEKAQSLAYASYVAPQNANWGHNSDEIAESLLDYNDAGGFNTEELRAVQYSLKDRVMGQAENILTEVQGILTQNSEIVNSYVAALITEANDITKAINDSHTHLKELTTDGKKLGQLTEKDKELDETGIKDGVTNSLSDIRAEVGIPSTSDKKLQKNTPVVNGNKRWLAFFSTVVLGTVTVSILISLSVFSFPAALLGAGTIGFAFVVTFAGAVFFPSLFGMFFIIFGSRLKTHRLKTLFKTAYADAPEIDELPKDSALLKLNNNVYGRGSNRRIFPEFIEQLHKLRISVKANTDDIPYRKFDANHSDDEEINEARRNDENISVLDHSDGDPSEIDEEEAHLIELPEIEGARESLVVENRHPESED